jgi:hypothetical protein
MTSGWTPISKGRQINLNSNIIEKNWKWSEEDILTHPINCHIRYNCELVWAIIVIQCRWSDDDPFSCCNESARVWPVSIRWFWYRSNSYNWKKWWRVRTFFVIKEKALLSSLHDCYFRITSWCPLYRIWWLWWKWSWEQIREGRSRFKNPHKLRLLV